MTRMAALLFLLGPLILPASPIRGSEPADSHDVEMACGPSSLAMAGRLLDRPVSPGELGRIMADVEHPCTLSELKQAAEKLGFRTLAVRLAANRPRLIRIPFIISLRDPEDPSTHGHFVVLYGAVNGKVQVLDYPRPPRFVAPSVLAKIWDGRALAVASNPEQLALISLPVSKTALWVRRAGGVLLIVSVVSLAVGLVRVFRERHGLRPHAT